MIESIERMRKLVNDNLVMGLRFQMNRELNKLESEIEQELNSGAERTCRNLDKRYNIMFKCSECGHWECQDFDGEKILPQTWNYCPNCGAKVVD